MGNIQFRLTANKWLIVDRGGTRFLENGNLYIRNEKEDSTWENAGIALPEKQ